MGEKLVAELKRSESTDTLARWMAHYVAELMLRAKHAPLPKREEAEQSCARAILDLWAQAQFFPAKRTAFDSVDRVIECIDSLHPDGGPHYLNNIWRALQARTHDGGIEVENFLQTAVAIDGAARSLIHHILAQALHAAGRDNAEWLELAQNLKEEDAFTELRMKIVREAWDEAEIKNLRVEQLEKRIAQFEDFSAAAQALKTSLLESLAAAKGTTAAATP
jgi:hypothetical protein